MNVIAQGLHIGETLVGTDRSLVVAFALPAVVDIHVDVAGVFIPVLTSMSALARMMLSLTLHSY